MDSRLDSFFAFLKTKQVTVVGIGVSNNPLIKLLLKKGIRVTVCDRKSPEKLGEAYEMLRSWGANMLVGSDYPESFPGDVIVRAPGVYFNSPQLAEARARGAAVTSEMELFFDYCPCKIYAVTGSEGKTTTTSIIAEMLQRQGKIVHLGGNIGRCLFGDIEDISHNDAAVVELSSFQLISMTRSPDVAVVTNVTPNHLDVHADMQEYIRAKQNIFIHQNAFSKCVLNADNAVTDSFRGMVRGRTLTYSMKGPQENGAYLSGGEIFYAENGKATRIMNSLDIKLPGEHNISNYLAAISAVWGAVEPGYMAEVARSFNGVEHRMEFVCEIDGVRYYNDSIASTPTRVIAGLKTFGKNVILIGGGYDKKIPFEPLAKPVIDVCKAVFLTGDTAEKMASVITNHPDYDPEKLPVIITADLAEAVNRARDTAVGGDIVTLSPACASFDRYPNFEVRGAEFKALVNRLR